MTNKRTLSTFLLVVLFWAAITLPSEAKKPAETNVEQSTVESSPETQALADYNQGVELFRAAQLEGAKGDGRSQERILKNAADKFLSALKANPDLLEAQSNLGFVYLTLKKYKNAIAAFQAALIMNDKHLNSLNGLATTFAFNDQITESIVTFDKLTTLAPANADYLFNMGAVLQKAGRIDDARVVYERALKVNPTHQRTLFNMGTLLENQGKSEEALGYYDRAKGAEIGNTVGLEALHRIDAIRQSLKDEQGPEPPPEDSKKADRKAQRRKGQP